MNLGWERTVVLNEAGGQSAGQYPAHGLPGVASGVQVTKVDCRGFREPHIISTLPAHIEDRSS
jgi:hypothetical protein